MVQPGGIWPDLTWSQGGESGMPFIAGAFMCRVLSLVRRKLRLAQDDI